MTSLCSQLLQALSASKGRAVRCIASILYEPITYCRYVEDTHGAGSSHAEQAWAVFRRSGLAEVVEQLLALSKSGAIARVGETEALDAYGVTDRFWSLVLDDAEGESRPQDRSNPDPELTDIEGLRSLSSSLDRFWPSMSLSSIGDWRRKEYIRIVSDFLLLAIGSLDIYQAGSIEARETMTLLNNMAARTAMARSRELLKTNTGAPSHVELLDLFANSRQWLQWLTEIDGAAFQRTCGQGPSRG